MSKPTDNPGDSQIYNVNVVARTILPTPAQVKADYPLSPALEGFILRNRRAGGDHRIAQRQDPDVRCRKAARTQLAREVCGHLRHLTRSGRGFHRDGAGRCRGARQWRAARPDAAAA